MTAVVIDLESRSTVDLKYTNAWNYAGHPTTGIWMARWVYDNDPDEIIHEWRPEGPHEAQRKLADFIANGGKVCAHNAEFEFSMINNNLAPWHGWPEIRLAQLSDTAARAARCGLPRKLEEAGKALNLLQQKDKAGSALMKRMAKPRKVNPDGSIVWWDVPERVDRLSEYCAQDVRTQLALHRLLPELPDQEWLYWQATLEANLRGVRIDLPFVAKARRVVDHKLAEYARELLLLTDGAVKSHTDLNGMKAWITRKGVPLDSFDKNVVAALLADDRVPDEVKRVAAIRAESGKSSVAKFPAMASHADAEGIARQQMVYYGAQATGRDSGYGIQLQNLPARGAVGYKDAEAFVDYLHACEDPAEAASTLEMLCDGSAIETLSMCLRSAVCARPAMDIVSADYSNIEGRKAAWLGGEQWKLAAFRAFDEGRGPDLYKVTAASIVGGTPDRIDKTTRNVMGKVPELALGFGGGVGAFVSMGAVYGVVMDDYYSLVKANISPEFWEKALENFDSFGNTSVCTREAWVASEAVKLAWRDRHPGIRAAWYDSEAAAIAACQNPGSVHHSCSGRLAFKAEHMWGRLVLLMRLPSGRCIWYQNVRLRLQKTPWGAEKHQIIFDKVEAGRIIRSGTYGGDIFQSAVQGSARDIMRAGWLRVQDHGYRVLFAVHDELVTEYFAGRADIHEFEKVMSELPAWATGLPVSASGYVGKRFRKDG